MLKLEEEKSYEFKLMPNISDPNLSFMQLTREQAEPRFRSLTYFTYYLKEDGKVDVLNIPKIIKEYVNKCIMGFVGTSEGYVISEDKETEIDHYYADDNKIDLYTPDEYDAMVEYKDEAELILLKKYTDVVSYKPFIIFDIKSPRNLVFKIVEDQGYKRFINIGIKTVDPIFKDGDEKSKIMSMYDGIENMEIVVEKEKQRMIKEYNKHNIKVY